MSSSTMRDFSARRGALCSRGTTKSGQGRQRDHRYRASIGQVVLASVLTLLLTVGLVGFSAAPVAAASCTTRRPTSGASLLSSCLSPPLNGALVSGKVTMSASVTTSGAAPCVQRGIYTLDGTYRLTRFYAPSLFQLPPAQWIHGQHILEARAPMSDGFTSAPTSLTLFLQSGVSSPPSIPNGFRSMAGSLPPPGEPFRIVAVGDGGEDGVCSAQGAQLMSGLSPNPFLSLGDLYEKGFYSEFLNHHGESGQLLAAYRSITNPVVGNHGYEGST